MTSLTTHLSALPSLPHTVAPPLRRHCPGPPGPPGQGCGGQRGREPLPPRGWGANRPRASQLADLRSQCGSGWLWALGWWQPLHPLIYFSAVSVLEKLGEGVLNRGCLYPHLSCTFFVMGFIFYFIILFFFFLIYDDSTPTHHPTPRPGSMASRALGSQEGASPTSALPPQALTVGSGSYQGLPLPPSLPLPALWNSPGAPRGPEGKAWLPKGVVAGGLPGKVAPPHPAPLPALSFSSGSNT